MKRIRKSSRQLGVVESLEQRQFLSADVLQGQVYADMNRNGRLDFDGGPFSPGGEAYRTGMLVFVDLDNDRVCDNEEPSDTMTDHFTLEGVSESQANLVRVAGMADWVETSRGIVNDAVLNVSSNLLRIGIAPPPNRGLIAGRVVDAADVPNRPRNGAGVQSMRVFLDTDRDATLDSNESYVFTDADGLFFFNGRDAATYAIGLATYGDWYQEYPANQSNVVVTLADGQAKTRVDFLVTNRPTMGWVGLSYFEDLDGDGTRDADESMEGNPPFITYADLNNNAKRDAGEPYGAGSLNNNKVQLSPGTYTLRAEKTISAYHLTTPGSVQVEVKAGDDRYVGPIGYQTSNFVSGSVFTDTYLSGGLADPGDGPGISGRTVYVDLNKNGQLDPAEPSTTTNSYGNYSFTDLPDGVYAIRTVVPSGQKQTFPIDGPSVVSLFGGLPVQNASFGVANTSRFTGVTVSGVAFIDANQNGVFDTGDPVLPRQRILDDRDRDGQVDLNEAWCWTDHLGRYELRNVPTGTAYIQNEQYIFSPFVNMWITRTITAGQNVDGFDIPGKPQGAASVVASGNVFVDLDRDGEQDADEPGFYDLEVYNVNASSGGAVEFARTDESGNYGFLYVRTDTEHYPLLQLPRGWRISSGDTTQLRFSATTGTVRLSPIGVYQEDQTSSGVMGNVTLPAATQTSTLASALMTLRAFAATTPIGRGIAARTVWADDNRNGVIDSGEIAALTDASGAFTLRGLTPGTHYIRQLLPTGWTQVTPTDGAGVQITVVDSKYVADQDFVSTRSTTTPTTTITLQAETGAMSGGTAKGSSNGGYLGTGYADFAGQGSAVAWTTSRATAGLAKLELRYANGATNNRPLQLLVNGTVVGTLNCEPTGSWTTWKTVSLSSIALPAGTVTIKAVASTSAGGANVDQLTITSAGTVVTPPVEPPVTPPATDVNFFEAETGTMSGGTAKSSGNAGFTGAGFADFAGQGSAVQFATSRSSAGTVTLEFRYANGSTTSRPLQILVNGIAIGTIACAPTGAWTTWKTVSLANVALPAGAVTIKAVASTAAGGANVDSMAIKTGTVTPPPPTTGDSDLTLEAESAKFANGTGKGSSNPGYTGTGYADYGGQGSAVDFVFNRTAPSTVSLLLRYGNGSTANRPLQILVNGNVVGTIACIPTGSWSTWQTATLSNITLPSGTVTVRAVASTSVGGANVDWLKVQKV